MWAAAGAAVTGIGIQELAWIIQRLPTGTTAVFTPERFGSDGRLLVWEAAVTGAAHARGDDAHVNDARLAVEEFISAAEIPATPSEPVVLNLAAAALVKSEVAGPELLGEPTIVVEPHVGGRGDLNRQLREVRVSFEGDPPYNDPSAVAANLKESLADAGITVRLGDHWSVPAQGYPNGSWLGGVDVHSNHGEVLGLILQDYGEAWVELPPSNWLHHAASCAEP